MVIRKISIGPDYKNSMHYTHGQDVLQGNYKIHLITQDINSGNVSIYIERNDEILLWKQINSNTPFSIEFNIEF